MEEDKKQEEIEIKQNITSTAKIYSIENYKIEKRRGTPKKEPKSFAEKMTKLQEINETTQLPKKSVYGVILVHNNEFPHVLIHHKQSLTNFRETIPLIGGKIENGEEPIEGLRQKISKQLGLKEKLNYEIGELLGTFYRVNYTNRVYPYLPGHVDGAKEVVLVYMIHISEKCEFSIGEHDTLNSIALFNLHNNTQHYHDVMCAIPVLVSRYCLIQG